MDFSLNVVACCKSRTLKFMRPRNVLLIFSVLDFIAKCIKFGAKSMDVEIENQGKSI